MNEVKVFFFFSIFTFLCAFSLESFPLKSQLYHLVA